MFNTTCHFRNKHDMIMGNARHGREICIFYYQYFVFDFYVETSKKDLYFLKNTIIMLKRMQFECGM